MIPARYFVVKCGENWRVEFGSVYWNGHETRQEALDAAVEAARETASRGRPAEVLVQDENKLWFTVWSSSSKAVSGHTS